MKNILKSYFKSYFKNWIEAFGLIIFVVIVFAIIVGMVGIPVEFNMRYSTISKDATTWDYSLNMNNEMSDDFVYHYYQANDTLFNDDKSNSPVIDLSKHLVNHNNKNLLEYLESIAPQGKTQAFIGDFIKTSWFETNNKKVHKGNPDEFILPTADGSGTTETLLIKNYMTPSWYNLMMSNYYQMDYALNQNIAHYYNQSIKQHPNKSYQLDQNFNMDYSFINEKKITYNFHLDSLNWNDGKKLSDNVILQTKDSRLPDKNGEILINDLFGIKNGIKIGDSISLFNGSDAVSGNFKVVGYGNKISDLFPGDAVGGMNADITKYGLVFMNNHDLKQSMDYLLQNNGGVQSPSFNDSQRITLRNAMTRTDLLKLYENPISSSNVMVSDNLPLLSFDQLPALTQVKSMTVTILVFVGLGIILLILALVFINFVLKKEMNKTIRQIGLFKAFGYSNSQLSWIFAVKTAITMVVGAAIGFAVSIPIQHFVYSMFGKVVTLNMDKVFGDAWFVIVIIIVLPAIFTLASFAMTWKYIRTPSLDLINDAIPIKAQPFSNFMGKIFSKANFIVRLQVAYTTRSIGKFIIIFILFFISSLLMIVQFDGSNLMKSMGTAMNQTYRSDLNHVYQLDDLYSQWNMDEKSHKISFQNQNNYNVQFSKYNDLADLKAKSKIDDSSLHKLLIEFNNQKHLNLISSLSSDTPLQTLFNQILQQSMVSVDNEDNDSVYLNDLAGFVVNANLDFKTNKLHADDAIKNGINELAAKVMPLTKFMADGYENPVISFNHVYYGPNSWTGLDIPATPTMDENYKVSKFDFNLINNDAKEYLNIKGVDDATWKALFAQKVTVSQPIPVLITHKFAQLDKMKVNDVFDLKITNNKNINSVPVKIAGIVANDNFSGNVYAAYQPFAQAYITGYRADHPFVNRIYGRNPVFDGKIDMKNMTDISKLRMTERDYSIFMNQKSYTFSNMLMQNKSLTKLMWAPMVGGPDYQSLSLLDVQRQAMDDAMKITNKSFTIFQVMDAFMLFVILVVIISSIVEETMNFILVMKSMGYFNNEINFIVIGNYIIEIIFAFLVAYGISFAIWTGALSIFANMAGIILPLPISWQTPVIVIAILVVIMLIGWLLSLRTIKTRSVTNIQQ